MNDRQSAYGGRQSAYGGSRVGGDPGSRGAHSGGRSSFSVGPERPQPAYVRPADRRIGILGGTFDPIHFGHLVIAEQVAEVLSLDRVLFVPARVPPHKPGVVVTPAEDRAEMVALAIGGNAAFILSRIELDRDGPSFTVDTLDILIDEAASQGVEREFFFILSSEAIAGLPAWRDPWRLLSLCRLAVVPRSGHPFPDRAWLDARFPGRADRIISVETLPLAHSASTIRERAIEGRSIRYLVPPAVETYIHEHRLYR